MTVDDYIFALLIIFAFASVLFTGKLIQIRSKRKWIQHTFKPGSIQYERYQKLLSTRLLLLGISAILVSLLLLAYDVYRIAHTPKFFLIAGFVAVVVLMGAAITPMVLSESNDKNQ